MLWTRHIHPTTGQDGDDFAVDLLGTLDRLEDNDDDQQAQFEATVTALFGSGLLVDTYPLTGTADHLFTTSGLNLTIAAHTSLIGFRFVHSSSHVLVVPDNVTRYVWEFQDSTDAVPHYTLTATNINPGSSDVPAILLGRVVTAFGSFTATDNLFGHVYPTAGTRRVAEEFNSAWDSTAGTGGSVHSVVASRLRYPGSLVEIYREGLLMDSSKVTNIDEDPLTYDFVDGFRPVSGDTVVMIYSPI